MARSGDRQEPWAMPLLRVRRSPLARRGRAMSRMRSMVRGQPAMGERVARASSMLRLEK